MTVEKGTTEQTTAPAPTPAHAALTPQQAIQNLNTIIERGIQRGGLFQNVSEVLIITDSINILTEAIR
jgi:hypothetical protein